MPAAPSGGIPPSEIDSLNTMLTASQLALLTDTCRIGRISAGAFAQVVASQACALYLADKDIRASQISDGLVFRLEVALAADLLPGDQIDKQAPDGSHQYFQIVDTDKGCTRAQILTGYGYRISSISW